jgi:hypothetical protein
MGSGRSRLGALLLVSQSLIASHCPLLAVGCAQKSGNGDRQDATQRNPAEMVGIRLPFVMFCRHQILVGACILCLAEGAAQPLNPLSDAARLQTVAVYRQQREFPENHPPTDEAGVLFHIPPVSSAVSSSAGFLADDSDWVVTNLLRRPSLSPHALLQQSDYYSEELPVLPETASLVTRA